MKTRKLLCSLAAVLGVNFVHASPIDYKSISTCNFTLPFVGFYGGINAGFSQLQSETNVNVNGNFQIPVPDNAVIVPNPTANVLFVNTNSSDEYKNSFIGGLNLGYGFNFPSSYSNVFFHLSVEGFTNYINSPTFTSYFVSNIFPINSINQGNPFLFLTRSKVRFDPLEYGIDFKPGLAFIRGALLYGRIGAAFDEVKISSNNSVLVSATSFLPVINPNRFTSLRFSKEENLGLRLGGGLEGYLSPNVTVHADYIYTDYGKINLSGITDAQGYGIPVFALPNIVIPIFITPNGFSNKSSIDVHNQTFLVGLNYYLDPYLVGESYNLCPDNFNGAYAGLRGGLNILQGSNFNSSTIINVPVFLGNQDVAGRVTQEQAHSANLFRDTGTGELFVGYGELLYSKFYLSAEGFLDPFGSSLHLNQLGTANYDFTNLFADTISNTILSTKSKLSTSSEFGIDLRPGIFIDNNTLLYGRIGFSYDEIKLKSSSSFNVATSSNILFPTSLSSFSVLSTSEEQNKFGLRIGGGIEEYLGYNISLTADYIYTDYGHLATNGIGPVNGNALPLLVVVPVVNPTGFVKHDSVNVSTQQVTLGIIYHLSI